MDLKRLSYFVAACEERNFKAAANRLGIGQSTLSGAMTTLAEEFGAPLFAHAKRQMHPTTAGLWLYRSALLNLHTEDFARKWIADGQKGSAVHLIVDIRANFVLSRLGKALSQAIQRFTRYHPNVFAQPCFSGIGEKPGRARSIAGAIAARRRSLIVIEVLPDSASPSACADDLEVAVIGDDHWVSVQAARHGQDAAAQRSSTAHVAPWLDKPMIDQLMAGELSKRTAIECSDEPVSQLPRLVMEQPTTAFLLPRSLVPARLDPNLFVTSPLAPELQCKVIARFDSQDAAARHLVSLVRDELSAGTGNREFDPVLTNRNIHYVRALFEQGSITAAARKLGIAQPALTSVVRKLEHTHGSLFFHRSREGLAPTAAGDRLDSASQVMTDCITRIAVQSAAVAGASGGRLKIGVGAMELFDSVTAKCIARAISTWQKDYPSIRLQVVQGSATALQELVVSGTVGFALTDRTAPGISRMKLTAREPLALIADPRFALLPPGPVALPDIARLPLILPTPAYATRQILDSAALEANVKLTPEMEVNAMAILLALLRELPFCSVLPKSSVQELLDNGTLEARMIADPVAARQIYASHSGYRELNDAERKLLAALRLEFLRATRSLEPASQNVPSTAR